jgi:sugar O-acyltransferase (sialic acid O-acetyltransferase NeuD family)
MTHNTTNDPAPILIFGAGGHARVIADVLLSAGETVQGFLDNYAPLHGTHILDLPVLGEVDRWREFPDARFIAAVGSNRARRDLVQALEADGLTRWANAIHPSAIIGRGVTLGRGVMIIAGAIINPYTTVGDHTIINTAASVDHDCTIGSFVHIAPGVRLAGTCTVRDGAMIGIGSAAIPKITVGEWAMVGAGATIVRDIPPNVTAKGTPARWQPPITR